MSIIGRVKCTKRSATGPFQTGGQALQLAGFAIHPASHAFSNTWIVENRFRDKVVLFRKFDNRLEPMSFPVTNMLLIAEKK